MEGCLQAGPLLLSLHNFIDSLRSIPKCLFRCLLPVQTGLHSLQNGHIHLIVFQRYRGMSYLQRLFQHLVFRCIIEIFVVKEIASCREQTAFCQLVHLYFL